ncbi:ArsR/SmtB family transcription factor [Streptomyces sp. NPDC102405]|uniref:ArsR/SmtB family transcription factor n=1 Tax=Streptomyces sp. NPDC102405 TaxID=3366170 RepID=UPI00381B5112
MSGGSPHGRELGALLDRTRAAILEGVVTGRTTGGLAARFGISGAAASRQTAVLRRAGLLLSVRHGKYVVHTVTPAGIALLEARPGPSVQRGPPEAGVVASGGQGGVLHVPDHRQEGRRPTLKPRLKRVVGQRRAGGGAGGPVRRGAGPGRSAAGRGEG